MLEDIAPKSGDLLLRRCRLVAVLQKVARFVSPGICFFVGLFSTEFVSVSPWHAEMQPGHQLERTTELALMLVAITDESCGIVGDVE